MLMPEQRNDRIAIVAALQGTDAKAPLVRAVIADIQHMDRRAREQIAFVGEIPDFINIPPVDDEAETVALEIWAGQFHHAISWQVRNEIIQALEMRIELEGLPSEPRTVWLV